MQPVIMPTSPTWWLTDWRPEPFGLALVGALALGYALLLARSRRHGVGWPRRRTAAFAVLGLGSLLYAVCGPLEADRTSVFWVAALQAGVLSAVTPAGLALGDPVGLVRAVPAPRVDRALRSWPVRALAFPLTASVLSVGSLVAVFFTGYFEASTRSATVAAVLELHLLITGLLFVVPLLTEGLLPLWVTPPVAALVAFADGLLDAVPGIMLMVSTTVLAPAFPGFAGLAAADAVWQQRWGGGVLLGATEIVGLPVLAAIFMAWVRRDEREARDVDARLDAPAPVPAGPTATPTEEREPEPDRPRMWWEDDPRFADRIYRR